MAITKKELIQFMDKLVDLASEKNNGKNMDMVNKLNNKHSNHTRKNNTNSTTNNSRILYWNNKKTLNYIQPAEPIGRLFYFKLKPRL